MNIKRAIKDRIESVQLLRYPLLISYPRTGTHWINVVMELYFDRPRLRKSRKTFLDKKRRDWMWMHDHDYDLSLIDKIDKMKNYKFKKILYLWRDPVDTIYSLIIFNLTHPEHKEFSYRTKEEAFSDKVVREHIKLLREHYQRYIGNPRCIVIRYGNFLDKNKRLKEFKKITDFFGKDFDSRKAEELFERFEKINLSKDSREKQIKRENYKREKEKFRKKWGKIIDREMGDVLKDK